MVAWKVFILIFAYFSLLPVQNLGISKKSSLITMLGRYFRLISINDKN